MKLYLRQGIFCLLILLPICCFSQTNPAFEFWISDLKKAAYSRNTYRVTTDSIIIKKGPYDFLYFAKDYEKDVVVFTLKLDSSQVKRFEMLGGKLKTDSIKTLYDNLCMVDGMIYHLHFEWGETIKSTTISNYYLPAVEPLIQYINTLLPEKFRLFYDKKWLLKQMKHCPPDRILD